MNSSTPRPSEKHKDLSVNCYGCQVEQGLISLTQWVLSRQMHRKPAEVALQARALLGYLKATADWGGASMGTTAAP